MKSKNIDINGINNDEARKLLIRICAEQKWKWWIDNEGKMIIDLDNSLDLGE